MSVVGIVAEYNPFHYGHLYHLHQAKEKTSAHAAICIMSGNFVQRGEPAIVDKWARAEMALRGGADLIFELPFAFAARSAYNFARGSVQLLERTGVVTHICFGSETDNLDLLQKIATVLADEPNEFRLSLKHHLSTGVSFPLARARALSWYFQLHQPGISPEMVSDLLTGPNNILGIEYLRVLHEEKSSLIPLIIPRRGHSYHSLQIDKYASATAIRDCLEKDCDHQTLAACLPLTSLDILKREFLAGKGPVFKQDPEQIILALLRRLDPAELAEIYDITEGLENRIKKAARKSNSLAELKKNIKTKRYNMTRINRILLYVLMNLKKSQVNAFDQTGPTYLHLLGFSPLGRKILLKMKSNCRISVLNKIKTGNKLLFGDAVARQMLELDFLATDLYSLFLEKKHRGGGKDYLTSPLFIDSSNTKFE